MTTTAAHPILSASTLSGDQVRNPEGEDLGTIKDIMIDTGSGRVAYAVLSFGGFLGMGDKLFAVPFKALNVCTESKSFTLDVDKQRLEKAHGFDPNDWPDMADQRWQTEVHDVYGADPYWK